MRISKKIAKRERRAIKKLGHSTRYKKILGFFLKVFNPIKKFIYIPFSAARKVFGVISLTIFKAFGYKIGYIDDFIVHKKLRGKGAGKKLFQTAENEAQKYKCDYIVLFSHRDRKASHKFYSKAGLSIIRLGLGIFAYKKIYSHKK